LKNLINSSAITRLQAIVCVVVITPSIAVAAYVFNIGNIRFGPGPVYIEEVKIGKLYYLQGEKVNLTVTVNNPQDWPVPEPSFVGYVIENEGFSLGECGVFIDYATPPPTFPAHSRTLYSPDTQGLTLPGRPGNYKLIVSLRGWGYDDKGNCTLEIRPNPAGFNYTESIMPGDWVKYDVSVDWTGSGTEPSSVTEFKQIEWVMDRIQSIGYFEVNETTHLKNGTDLFWSCGGDLSVPGVSNSWMIFPPGLKKGDTFQLYPCPPSLQNFRPDYVPSIVNVVIDETITMNYAGSSRSVNVWNSPSSDGGLQGGTLIWDQKTGVLLEFVQRASLAGGTVQWSYKASETNMWGSGERG